MFKRITVTIILCLSIVSIVRAQSTSVSASIVDAGGQAWINGTYTFTSAALGQTPITGTLDASGAFTSITFPHNSFTAAVGDVWTAKICPDATSGCFTKAVAISGATQSLSSTLIPAAISLSIPFYPAAISTIRAYADAEITATPKGGAYYNTTSSVIRVCTTVSGTTCTVWSGVGSDGVDATFSGTVTANIGSFNSIGTNFIDIACAAQSVSNSNQDRFSCDGTNWPIVSMNAAAAQKLGLSMGVNAQTVNYTAVQSDCGKLITMSGVSLTFTLPAAIINSACVFDVKNLAATSLTIGRNGLNVDGAASNPTALTQNQSYRITNDGAGYWTEALQISQAATVSSVFSRTGAVVAAANDYTLDQVGNPVAAVSFQPTVDAGILFKQSNTTNTADVFHVQSKGAVEWFRVDSAGTVRIAANACTFTTGSADCSGAASLFALSGVNNVVGGTYRLLVGRTAPTISSGFGSSPSIVAQNGPAAFTVNVGTGGSASSGVIGLPTAANGWSCQANDQTTTSATVFITKQTANTTTTVTLGNFSTAGASAAWAASDVLNVNCFGF